MSLTRTAIRLSAVRALRSANTWCGNSAKSVRDSEQAAIEEADQNSAQPYLVVYTDSFTSQPAARGLLAPGTQDLVVEITLTPRMDVQQRVVGEDEAGNPIVEEVPVWVDTLTDAAMEITVEAIERQVRNALMSPDNEWAEIFRMFVTGFADFTSHRGASHREGLRFVGRQLKFTCQAVQEAAPGDAKQLQVGARWRRFLDTLRAEGGASIKVADLIEGELAGNPAWTQGEMTRGHWGITADEARAMLSDDHAGMPPPEPETAP